MQSLEILQIEDIGNCDYAFRGWKHAKDKFNPKDYKIVYEDFTDKTLDGLFREFNRVTEEDCIRLEDLGYKGRSLSSSDIIKLDDKYYYCDSLGWEDVTEYFDLGK